MKTERKNKKAKNEIESNSKATNVIVHIYLHEVLCFNKIWPKKKINNLKFYMFYKRSQEQVQS